MNMYISIELYIYIYISYHSYIILTIKILPGPILEAAGNLLKASKSISK